MPMSAFVQHWTEWRRVDAGQACPLTLFGMFLKLFSDINRLYDAIWQVQLTADPAMSGRTELVVDLNEQVTLTFLAATEGDMKF